MLGSLFSPQEIGARIIDGAPSPHAGGRCPHYLYQGNWTTVTDPAGKWKQYESDVFGNTLVVVEPDPAVNPNIPNPPSATAAGALVTKYSYDLVNHLTGVSMPRTVSGTPVTQTRSFVYNASMQLTSTDNPETGTASANGVTSYTYNADGTLATRTDPKTQVTGYSYDSYQRVTKVTHGTDATQTINCFYDTDPLDTNGTFAQNTWGRVAAIEIGTCNSGPGYAEEHSYNSAGLAMAKRVSVYKALNQNCGPVVMTGNFNYDSEGKTTSVTYPAGTAPGQYAALTVNYSYDSMSRLVSVNDTELNATVGGCSPAPPAWNGAVTWATSAAYNAAGQLTGLQQLGSVSATCAGTAEQSFNQAWQYNALNQLSEIDTSAQTNGYPAPSANPGLASYFFARYHYAATANNGQISQTDDARLGYSIGYAYDALKRLTSTTMGQGQTFSYDGFGNLTTKSVPAGSAEPVFPGVNSAKNQLTGVSYDLNGNVTALNNFGLTYDVENRLVSATQMSSTETYAYDASNHRIEKIWKGNDTVYFYGPNGKILAEFSLTATPGVSWYSYLRLDAVYFGSMLVGTTQGVATTEYSSIVDRLGTGHPGYAYGTDIGPRGSTGLYDCATYLNDSVTGFEYANQRWYSAGFGRMLSVDQDGSSAHVSLPGSWNRFAYSLGDPVNFSDPSGNYTTCLGAPSDYNGAHCYYDASDHTSSNGPKLSGPNSTGGQISVDFPTLLPSLDNLFDPPDPPTPISPQSPTCSVSLYSRPVPSKGSSGNHTYLLLDDSAWNGNDSNGNPIPGERVVEGGPSSAGLSGALTGTLIGYVGAVGQTLGGSNPAFASNTEVGSPWTAANTCTIVQELVGDVYGYNSGPKVHYTFLGWFGYKSNSFTFTLLQEAGLLAFFGNPPGWTPGWKETVPGL